VQCDVTDLQSDCNSICSCDNVSFKQCSNSEIVSESNLDVKLS
jgi:hypothetical protein